MEITYFGNTAFRLRGKDVSVVTDPNGGSVKSPPTVVTLSNGSSKPAVPVGNTARVISGPGEYEVAEILIAGVATAQEPSKGALNTAYVIRFDDVAVCHLGKLGNPLTDKQVEELGDIDVLLVPAGAERGLTATKAAEVVHQLEPSIVIPMDFKEKSDQTDSPVEVFCREMGVKEFTPEPKFSVVKGNLGQTVRVVVLEPKGSAGG